MKINQKNNNNINNNDYLETSILTNEIKNKNNNIYEYKNINKKKIKNILLLFIL